MQVNLTANTNLESLDEFKRLIIREEEGALACRASSAGAVAVVQRTSSDLRLNPHLHVLLLDGTYHEQGNELWWRELGRLWTQEVGEVLERAVRRIERYLRGRGLLDAGGEPEAQVTPHDALS